MNGTRLDIEILKLFSEIISKTINEIDSFQISLLNGKNEHNTITIGRDILIIHVIGSKLDCSMKDIIIATGLPNSTATRRVGFLVENGLVIRKKSRIDRRKAILRLSKSGKRSFSLFFDYISHKFKEILKKSDQAEKERLIKVFKRLSYSSPSQN